MIAFLIVIHVICCLGLILIVLLQAGKGAGLASTFGAQTVESVLGAGASDFLKKVTSVIAVVFMLTSLGLAFLTARKSASVLKETKPLQQSEGVSRQVKVTPEGEVVTEEKIIPGLEGKSKKELQQVLNEITQKLPLGQKKKAETQKETTETPVETTPAKQEIESKEASPSAPVLQETVVEEAETPTKSETVSQTEAISGESPAPSSTPAMPSEQTESSQTSATP
jgi:preprotein translocase subunit SecG